MIKKIPFIKSTSFGNNFVIVDETDAPLLTESEKSRFAYRATDMNFGVGSDNFLVIQTCNLNALTDINKARHYWDDTPDFKTADYIFRMFEPNGAEALSCANGLMCIAGYLSQKYGIESARIMTQIPTSRPKVVSVGTYMDHGTSWANMGHPNRIPEQMPDYSFTLPHDNFIDAISGIEITFRKHDLAPLSQSQLLNVSGHLVFTGEPHLVVFAEDGFSLKELSTTMFIASGSNSLKIERPEKRVAFGSWLIHHIGTYLNNHYPHLFPAGINVNFARLAPGADVLEYRCFERGINRETLACGTGALAVAFVARRLKLLQAKQIRARPHLCRWYEPEAEILLVGSERGWMLHGNPVLLVEGVFTFRDSRSEKREARRITNPSVNPRTLPVERTAAQSTVFSQ